MSEKVCGYARFATYEQADPVLEQRLETVRTVQNMGYVASIAPVRFDGDPVTTKKLPLIVGLGPYHPDVCKVRDMLQADGTLVLSSPSQEVTYE